MPEYDDELAAMRKANPVDAGSLPSPTSPSAHALFERIQMSANSTEEVNEEVSLLRRPRVIAVAAAAVLALAVGVGVALNQDDAASPRQATSDTTQAPITPGGALGSCVESYNLTTLAHREVAFAGTVTSVAGDSVTFAVDEAFKGVSGNRVTLEGASTVGGVTSAGDSVSLAPGTRLLVSGDGGFAWSCGFTQPYDDATAAQWREALRR
jgi:hypothetical protein